MAKKCLKWGKGKGGRKVCRKWTKKKKRKLTEQAKKFRTVAKAANAYCHRTTKSSAAFSRCMKTEMKKGLKQAYK